MERIIDVSQYNGSINWNKVDCDGAFIRVGYRGYTVGSIKQDKRFLENIQGANNAGIATGCYFMSQAINESEAIEEANYIADQINSFEVTLPIFYDSELSGAKNNTGRADKLSKIQRTAICKAFCNRMKELGFLPGVYASTSWFRSNLDVSQLLEYYVWVAQYASTCTVTHRKDMWQYTSKGSMAGVSGDVDISHCYTAFDIPEQTTQAVAVTNPSSIDTFQVKVTASSLRIRKGPGTNHSQTGSIRDKGVYTITETSNNWGCLKSGAGWICLDYTKRL